MTSNVRIFSIELPRAFAMAIAVNLVWINASEIFRYFAFIRSLMQRAFPQFPDIVPMNLPVFLSWGIWDTLVLLAVSGFTWLFLDRFGNGFRNAVLAGSLVWLAIFVILWLGLLNMNLATLQIVFIALPLAWIEMVVAALIVDWCRVKFPQSH
jgi:hypothetical protein